jgi:hypothetical protein
MTMDPTSTAIGTWSGGRFMHFGEPLADRWELSGELQELSARWEIAPQRDLVKIS